MNKKDISQAYSMQVFSELKLYYKLYVTGIKALKMNAMHKAQGKKLENYSAQIAGTDPEVVLWGCLNTTFSRSYFMLWGF